MGTFITNAHSVICFYTSIYHIGLIYFIFTCYIFRLLTLPRQNARLSIIQVSCGILMNKFLFANLFFLTLIPTSYAAEYMPGGMIDINSIEVNTNDAYFVECSGTAFKPATISPAWLDYQYGHLDNPPTPTIDPNKANIGEWSFKVPGYWEDNTYPEFPGHIWYRFRLNSSGGQPSVFNFNGNTSTFQRINLNIIDVVQWGTNFSTEDVGSPTDIPITSFSLGSDDYFAQAGDFLEQDNSPIPPKYTDFPYGRFILYISGGIVEPDYFSYASCLTYKADNSEDSVAPQNPNQDSSSPDSGSGSSGTSGGAFNGWGILLLMIGFIFRKILIYFTQKSLTNSHNRY